MSSSIDNLIQYGVDKTLAELAVYKGLNVTTIKNTSREKLIKNYDLTEIESKKLRKAVQRKPIDKKIVKQLLFNNRYVCCLCRGQKSDAYIIHHIKHYNQTQDNTYENLAVLCPNDHELAHREGEALANKINPDQIMHAKWRWEKEVERKDCIKSARMCEVDDLDFVNVPRIMELAIQLNHSIPFTTYTDELLSRGLIKDDGSINEVSVPPATPLKFFLGHGSAKLTHHYYQILIQALENIELHNLEDLLNKKIISDGIIGEYCFYSGGLYGKKPTGEINQNSAPTYLHYRKKPFFVKWLFAPMYLTSETAQWRSYKRPTYSVYGKITNVDEKNGEFHIEIRPYAFGIPRKIIDKTPPIRYIKEYENESLEENEDL